MQNFLTDLKEKLAGDLPGQAAQHKMSHPVRRLAQPAPATARKAGVLCLFYEKNDEPYVVFIQRTSSNSNDRHGGQIAFPGGKAEESDADMTATALRETEEEIGIPAADIDILGALTPLYIPVSDFRVFPFVGYVDYAPTFVPQEAEVAAVLEIPFSLLQDKISRKVKDMRFSENIIMKDMPYFDLQGYTLWGATAMMMSELLELVDGW